MTFFPPEFTINIPNSEQRVLLHSCCAPCSGGIIDRMASCKAALTVLFYNPNIHPAEEYERRKQDVLKFCNKRNIPSIDLDYDTAAWDRQIAGWENEPERGRRCFLCFCLRLNRTAQFASQHGFKIFATSLGISRWKNLDQVNQAGREAAALHDGLMFWDFDWRKNNGLKYSDALARQEKFYRQNYCGCRFSLTRLSCSPAGHFLPRN